MVSPLCTVNGSSTVNGINVPGGILATIALADTTGVTSWTLTCIGTDDLHDYSTITSGLSFSGYTATFFPPNDTDGCTMIFRSTVNGGTTGGQTDPTLVNTFGVFVLTGRSSRLLSLNETVETNAAFGILADINTYARNGDTINALVIPNSSSYNVQLTDYYILVTDLTIDATIYLPTSPPVGRTVIIKDGTGICGKQITNEAGTITTRGTNITVRAQAGQYIEPGPSTNQQEYIYVMNHPNQSLTLVFDGSYWRIINES